MTEQYTLTNLVQTKEVACSLLAKLVPGDVVVFEGNLGAGKTTFIQFMCHELGVEEYVNSPTFTIINEYLTGKYKVNHIDFYRLNSEEELREIGIEQYYNAQDLTFIEWGNKFPEMLPDKYYEIKISYINEVRELTIELLG